MESVPMSQLEETNVMEIKEMHKGHIGTKLLRSLNHRLECQVQGKNSPHQWCSSRNSEVIADKHVDSYPGLLNGAA